MPAPPDVSISGIGPFRMQLLSPDGQPRGWLGVIRSGAVWPAALVTNPDEAVMLERRADDYYTLWGTEYYLAPSWNGWVGFYNPVDGTRWSLLPGGQFRSAYNTNMPALYVTLNILRYAAYRTSFAWK